MRISAFIATGLAPFLQGAATQQAGTSTPLSLHKILNGTILLGQPLKPITIPGGVRVLEPVVGGSINGSALNGTILGGIAHPAVHYNSTQQVPIIEIWGQTDDGDPFYIHETGVGKPSSQVTRIEIEIDGPYLADAKEFIIASVAPNEDRTKVFVDAYFVQH